jgi:hypothetical protein
MNKTLTLPALALVCAFVGLASGCIIAPHDAYREGYYDHDQHRYWHEHAWHDCGEHDDHCR